MLLQHLRGLLRPDAGSAGDLVRRVAAQRDEVRHLARLDAVALAHLARADPGQLRDALDRLEDRHAVADQLEGVAVRRDDRDRARANRRPPRRGSRRLRSRAPCRRRTRTTPSGRATRSAARGWRPRTRALTGRRAARHAGRSASRASPSRPAPSRAARHPRAGSGNLRSRRGHSRAAVAADRLRHRVVRAMGQGVAVDRQERLAHAVTSSSAIAAITRSVAMRAASAAG